MTKGLIGFLLLVLASLPCAAQQQKGVEVPFLPYVQMNGPGVIPVDNTNAKAPFNTMHQTKKRVSTVFFKSDSSTTIQKKDLPIIKAVANRVVQQDSAVRLVGYRTSKMSPNIVTDRMEAVANALRDLGVTRILFESEVRKNNVISVNRVDIFEL